MYIGGTNDTQMLHYSFKLLINKITKSIAFTT